MKEIYHYKGFGRCDSKCGLEIIKEDNKVKVTMTELPDNPGTSVTNMVEQLASMIYDQFLKDIPPGNITWVERYPAAKPREGTFDKVIMEYDGYVFYNPRWERLKEVRD